MTNITASGITYLAATFSIDGYDHLTFDDMACTGARGTYTREVVTVTVAECHVVPVFKSGFEVK